VTILGERKLIAGLAFDQALTTTAGAVAQAVVAAEADTLRAKAAQSAARQALDVARQPLAEAERNTQRLKTEAKMLARLLRSATISTPVEATAPIHWGGATVDVADPPLPAGVVALTSFITTAPDAMARPDRRRRPERGAARSPRTQARPAIGLAGRRFVALGRFCRRRQCADRGAPAATASPTSRRSYASSGPTSMRGGRP
jgi:hypothetical protein